ncbi:MAG: MBL fold metallo-hydrolase [Bacteroidales bacterium]
MSKNKFISLSSGSNGNCYYIGNGDTGLLIDVGIGGRTIKKRLQEYNVDIKSIKMILVSHEHFDHIKYLQSVATKLSVPVYGTALLHNSLYKHKCTQEGLGGCKRVIKNNEENVNLGISFTSFHVSHDASDCVGYYIDFKGEKFVFMTDIGDFSDEACSYARKADHLVLESNYDVDMLMNGSYPPLLKNRVMGPTGHLSNEQCASALIRSYHEGLKNVFLCHLSEQNNTPELAYHGASIALKSIDVMVGKDVFLTCLPRKSSFLREF